MFKAVRAVMMFSPDPEQACRWWSKVLDVPVNLDVVGDSVFAWLELDGVEFGFHQADDERNPRGGGSPVVYWSVDDLDKVREVLLAAGCEHHRGPLLAEPGRRIAQLRDPFGTIFGIDGP